MKYILLVLLVMNLYYVNWNHKRFVEIREDIRYNNNLIQGLETDTIMVSRKELNLIDL